MQRAVQEEAHPTLTGLLHELRRDECRRLSRPAAQQLLDESALGRSVAEPTAERELEFRVGGDDADELEQLAFDIGRRAPIAAARIASSSMPETRSSVEDQRCETAELSSRTETGLYAAKTTVAT